MKSICVLEKIQVAIRGEISLCFRRDLGCYFGMESVHVLEKIQAAIWGEISLCFGRDLGCCSG